MKRWMVIAYSSRQFLLTRGTLFLDVEQSPLHIVSMNPLLFAWTWHNFGVHMRTVFGSCFLLEMPSRLMYLICLNSFISGFALQSSGPIRSNLWMDFMMGWHIFFSAIDGILHFDFHECNSITITI